MLVTSYEVDADSEHNGGDEEGDNEESGDDIEKGNEEITDQSTSSLEEPLLWRIVSGVGALYERHMLCIQYDNI